MKTAVVTGANGGLGFEFVKCLTELGWEVKATARNPKKDSDLKTYANKNSTVQVYELDLASTDSIDFFLEELEKNTDKIDLLINNAGINSKSNSDYSMGSSVRFGELENKSIENIIHINSTAPLMLSQKLTRYLEKANSPCILNISSWLGSIGGKKGGGNYGYCGSKALLNMYSKAMAHDLREKNIRVFAINPGWMKTKMGGEKAELLPSESAKAIIEIVKKFLFR